MKDGKQIIVFGIKKSKLPFNKMKSVHSNNTQFNFHV